MRTLLTLLILFFSLSKVSAQPINWIDEYPLNSTGSHFGNSVCKDSNENVYFISHHTGGTADDGTQYGSFLYKYNKTGVLLWRKFYSTTSIASVCYDKKRGLYLSGVFQNQADFGCGELIDPIDGGIDKMATLFVAKLDTNGNCQWSKMVPYAQFGRMAVDETGDNIYVIGNRRRDIENDCFYKLNQSAQYIAKFDSNGNCKWVNTILAFGNPFGIDVNDKYVAVTGKIFGPTGYFGPDSSAYSITGETNHNIYTALYDLDGNFLWAKHTVKNTIATKSNSVTIDKENNVYVTGFVGGSNTKTIIEGQEIEDNSTHNAFVVKYNEQGEMVFVKVTMGPSFEEGKAIYAAEDGVFWSSTFANQITIGDTTIVTGTHSVFIAKMDFNFKKVHWVKVFSVGWQSDVHQLTTDNEGTLLVAGNYSGFLENEGNRLLENSNWNQKPFVMSINDTTEIIPTFIKKNEGLDFFKVFPNPNSGNFTIETSLAGTKTISIRSISGAKVYEETTANSKIEISNLKYPPGIYFVELFNEKERQVKKIVLNY